MRHHISNNPVGSPAWLGGSLVTLATPFRAGQLDETALAGMCDRQVRSGTITLVVCGSTGEAPVQLAGDDSTAAAYRAMGGHGCVSVTANIVPALCAQFHAAWDRGDLAAVAHLRDLLAPLHQALFLESNPIPLKAALAMLDLCTGDLRLPLTRATPATCGRLADLLPGLMQAEDEATRKPHLTLVR